MPHHQETAPSGRYPAPDDVLGFAEHLVTNHKDRCRLSVVGHSRQGRPLHVLTIGAGHRHVLVVAGAHPNEPVGGATLRALADHLTAQGALAGDTTWHLLLCLDPDGAHLNGRDATTLTAYYRGFYRPRVREQPEWAPSVAGAAPLPESQALLQVVERYRPALQVSLHSTDVGGTYTLLTRPVDGFAEVFADSARAARLPVETATMDAGYWPTPGPGIYLLPPPGAPERPTVFSEDAHRSTWLAPHAHGGTTAIVEVPVFASDRLSAAAEHPEPEAALREAAELLRSLSRELTAHLDKVRDILPPLGADAEATALRSSVEENLAISYALADTWDPRNPAFTPVPGLTSARAASLELFARRLPLNVVGMLARLVGIPAREGVPRAESAAEALDALLVRWCDAYADSFQVRPVPVADQVAHQLRSVLALAERVRLPEPAGDVAP